MKEIKSFEELSTFVHEEYDLHTDICYESLFVICKCIFDYDSSVYRTLSGKKYAGIKKLLNIKVLKKFWIDINRIRRAFSVGQWTYYAFYKDKKKIVERAEKQYQDLVENGNEYFRVYEILDESSKQIYINLILHRLTGDIEYISSVFSENEQYFTDKIDWRTQQNGIVDCGAYNGDTLEKVIEKKINFKKYYAFEIEENNYKDLCSSINRYSQENINKIELWNKEGKIFFVANADSSKIVEYETENFVEVNTIDSIVDTDIDYIKMDIEGSEYEALLGAENTICRNKPVLAICIYHKQDDYWKIPLLIHKMCPKYNKFWIEHYSYGLNETVFYAMAQLGDNND